MKKTLASTKFINRMNDEAARLRALSTALDKAVEQFGANRLAATMLSPNKTPA
jgi:hypothetical protein